MRAYHLAAFLAPFAQRTSAVAESIECPSCRNAVSLRDLRPGRFRIACPECGVGLFLTVPDDPTGVIRAVAEVKAAPIQAPPADDRSAEDLIQSGRLGRYQVVAPGRGRAWGIGPAVALSVVRDRWVTDPRFLAGWVLEAIAATGLRYPNLAGPFGVDVVGNRVFAEAAIGRGVPLSDPSRGRGTLDRQGRVAAVLHAARGLRLAHEQGVYHRDLGLDSIRVDPDGLITLAGLGVNFTPRSDPAPVPPVALSEPGASVVPAPDGPLDSDVPNDVAGLGRVLATLLAGATGDRAVPPGLAALVRRMTGGGGAEGLVEIDPVERFRDLGAVVRALEAELGVAGPLMPTEAEAAVFEGTIAEYQGAPLGPLRRWAGLGTGVVISLVALGMLAMGRVVPALGWMSFGGLFAAGLAGLHGWNARERIKERIGPVLAVVGRHELTAIGVAGLIGLATLFLTHLLMTGLIVVALAVGLAAAFHFGFDRPVDRSRDEALARLRGLVVGWRRLGTDESAIRRYVAAAGGTAWEEVFGALFGFDAIEPARSQWGADLAGKRRPRFAPVRGWLLGRFDAWVARRGAERTRSLLEPILERDLEARGLHVLTARRKAKRASQAVVGVLGQFRRAPDGSVGLPLASALRRAVDSPEDFLASPEIAEAATAPSRVWSLLATTYEAVLGPWVRFVLGAAALAGSVVWMERNELISYDQAKTAAYTGAIEGDRVGAIAQAKDMSRKFAEGLTRVVNAPDEAEVMRLGLIDLEVSRHLNGFALVASALILIASSFVRGPRIIPFALIGALLPLIPSTRPLEPISLAAMALGAGVFAVGTYWNRGHQFDS